MKKTIPYGTTFYLSNIICDEGILNSGAIIHSL